MNVRSSIQNGVVPTLCRMCDTRCAINVHLKEGVISDITPFEGHPVNQGRDCTTNITEITHGSILKLDFTGEPHPNGHTHEIY